ncbi:LamG-like jellyroll fold domain-containing protein [Lentzea sp. BCCO 10_0798]|uniref:LamG-like jellyroll fold domain-containing protein n=1 Tax=Lentzea kristufekii TaxID=3095430 RepID=A0ABU4U2C9_9PSEU|nr:LamG-like jellyroll fold domain-containing protein [Lentzea sp. BCCO 10_0798]MDX8054727.1 LamG-like jellyroll fold domain-containing protein [Lentzea sp. BCCO 10_0798]
MLAAAATVLSLTQPATAAPRPEPAAPQPAAAPQSETNAATEATEAQRTGQPVEISEKTTENSVVRANPDGTMTLSVHNQPVRVKRDGKWTATDNSLVRHADGKIAPKASTSDLTFSGGGDGPLATLKDGDKSVSLNWDKRLPTPVIDGDSATYPGVLPGVDLKVKANNLGYSHVLVVHNAEAAANPELTRIKYRLSGDGVQLSESDDLLKASDSKGNVAFGGSSPIMWDSSKAGKPGSVQGIDPSNGKISKLDVTAKPAGDGATEVEIKPAPGALTGPDVRYPVYIDPPLSKNRTNWITVTSAGWQTWNTGDWAKVGYCDRYRDSSCGGSSFKARSYFDFPVSELNHRFGYEATIFDAGFWVTQAHTAMGCTSEPTVAMIGSGINSGTRWPGPASTTDIDTKWSNVGDQCGGAREVEFEVEGVARDAARWDYQWLNLGLRAPGNEDTMDHWKRFGNNPRLDIKFSFRPQNPKPYSVSNAVICNGSIRTPDSKPTVSSTMEDSNNPALNLHLFHEIINADGTTVAKTGVPPEISSGSVGSFTSDNTLIDGLYKYKSYGRNIYPGNAGYYLWSDESPHTHFYVRGTPITQVPTIKSDDYVGGYWSRPQNQPGKFTFNSNGGKYISGFTYTFAGAGTEVAPSTTDCDYNRTFANGGWVGTTNGSATITVPSGLSPGRHTLHVRSFDEAHKLSPESQAFEFYVSPSFVTPAPTAKYEFENTPDVYSPESQGMEFSFVPDAAASGGKYLSMQSTTDGAWVTFEFRVPANGDYDIIAGLMNSTTAWPDQLTFALDGALVSKPFVSNSTTSRYDKQKLAGVQLTEGWHRLKVTMNKKPGSTATTFKTGFDFLELSPTVKLDAEVMPVVATDKPLDHMPDCCGPAWNSNAQRRFDNDELGKSFTLEFSTPIEADYSVGLGMTAAFHYGNFSVKIDDRPIGRTDTTPVNGYDPAAVAKFVPLNGVHLTAGKHRITFTAVGTDPASTHARYRIGLDYLTFLPINNVTTASFTDAMNNRGIGNDAGPTAALDYVNSGLSTEAMTAAGLAPGSVLSVNGATFTMPARNPATGNDNVVAIGQTIPFPAAQQVKANSVGLLVLSTAGETAARNATITYTDGTTSDPTMPKVGDWTAAPLQTDEIVLPYWKVLSTVDRTRRPVIRPVFLPTDPNKTLKSITLPNSGAALAPGVISTALHVLAMAPRPVDAGWVGTWAAPADGAVVPPDGHWFTDRTLRTVLKPTVRGAQVRVKFSNVGNDSPLQIGAASVAAQSGTEAATTAAPTALKFSGNASVTLNAGAEIYSDPIAMPGGNGNLVVSTYIPTGTTLAAVHGGASAPTFLAWNNNVADTTGTPFTTTLTGSYFVSAVDVSTADAGAGTVVVLGDSLSATAPPGTAQRDTWVDHLPGKLGSVGQVLPGGLVNASRAGVPDVGRWKLNDGSGTVARDSAGTAPATATGNVTFSPDHNGSVLLSGSGAALATSGKVVDTTRNFSVSAWVKTRSLTTAQTAVSQEGANADGFALHYSPTTRRWIFTLRGSDSTTSPWVRDMPSWDEATTDWTHLTGTFDAETRTAKLYVNGKLQGAIYDVIPFAANGKFVIGRSLSGASNHVNWFNGNVSDVRAHQRVLTVNDALLSYQQPDFAPFPNTGVLLGPDYKTEIERSVLSSANARTALVALGSAELLRGVPADQVRASLTDLINSRTGLKKQLRQDGTALHVVLTTIPPLGLAAGDPREVQRQQLNADMLTNYRNYDADHIVDFDAAVRDSGDASKVAAQYLTNGMPNDAYHGRLAEYLAEAVNDFPPRAEL